MKKIPIVDFTSNYIFYEKTKKGYYYFYRFSEKQFSEYNKKAFFKLMSHSSLADSSPSSLLSCKADHSLS